MPSAPDHRAPLIAIVLRALVYALAITALVLYAPSTEHIFIYQGF
jgi:hypothetical protein